MARKATQTRSDALRGLRAGTVINAISSSQEQALGRALTRVVADLATEFPHITLAHERQWSLRPIVAKLQAEWPTIDFAEPGARSAMRPDGGILSLVALDRTTHPILISEKKNQGTNARRLAEGKKKQASGNAIERLGKNVIGFRTAMMAEGIFPFVCFADGCDFAEGSSILDRAVTIAMFGELNRENVTKLGLRGEFGRGTFYFREREWTEDEMYERSLSIARRSIFHYFSVYGPAHFGHAAP